MTARISGWILVVALGAALATSPAGAAEMAQYDAGFSFGRGAVQVCKLQSGDKALVWGFLGQEARGQRIKGVIDAFEKAGVKVEYLEISDAVNKNAAVGIPVFASFAAANPDLKAVVTDNGALTATVGAYMNAAGRGYDLGLRRRIRRVKSFELATPPDPGVRC